MFTSNNHKNFRSFWGSGCLFPPINTSDAECKIAGAIAEKLIVKDVEPGDVVIVGNQMLNYSSTDDANLQNVKQKNVVSRDLNNEYFAALKEFASFISNKQVSLSFYIDSVQFPNLQVGALCTKEWIRPFVPKS